MILNEFKEINLLDIVNIEKAKKDKQYEKGNIIIQVYATKGQIFYLENKQIVESKYIVLIPKIKIHSKYLYYILSDVLPDFLIKYQTDINIQPEIFKFLKLKIHSDINIQNKIADILSNIDKQIENENKEIEKIKDFKKWHLDKMFP